MGKRINAKKKLPATNSREEWRRMDEDFEVKMFEKERKTWIGWMSTRAMLICHIRSQEDDVRKFLLRFKIIGFVCVICAILSTAALIMSLSG